jgi:SAM-dependent methyltransferase
MASCPICSGQKLSLVHRRLTQVMIHVAADHRPSEEDRAPLTIVRCHHCGHLFNREFDEGLLPRMYGPNPQTNVPVDPSMIKRLTSLAHWIGDEHYRGKRVLEIGAGTGHFAFELALEAREVTIFEPSLHLNAGEAGLANVSIINRPFPDGQGNDPVDFIACRQVIEHVVSPIDLLSAICAMLRPGGSAYLEVPAAEFVERHASPIDFCLQHIHYFFEENFRVLLDRAQLVIERQLDIKNGHDIGFLVRAGVTRAAPARRQAKPKDDLALRIAGQIAVARSHFDGLSGKAVALYGANSYGQAFLDLWPTVDIATVLDDNPAFGGYALCGATRAIAIELPLPERIMAMDAVIIAAYLHDEVIARKLRQQGYAGRILSLRPSPLTPSPDRVEGVLAQRSP